MNGKILSITVATGLLFGTGVLGYAQSSRQRMPEPGASGYAPGQQMQDKGAAPGQPGASDFAPGQQMQDKGNKSGQPGASGYAPGQQSPATTGRGSMGDRDPDRDRGDAR